MPFYSFAIFIKQFLIFLSFGNSFVTPSLMNSTTVQCTSLQQPDSILLGRIVYFTEQYLWPNEKRPKRGKCKQTQYQSRMFDHAQWKQIQCDCQNPFNHFICLIFSAKLYKIVKKRAWHKIICRKFGFGFSCGDCMPSTG